MAYYVSEYTAQGSGSGASWSIPNPSGQVPEIGDTVIVWAAARGRNTAIAVESGWNFTTPVSVGTSPVFGRALIFWKEIMTTWVNPVVNVSGATDNNIFNAVLILYKGEATITASVSSSNATGNVNAPSVTIPAETHTLFYFNSDQTIGVKTVTGATEIGQFSLTGTTYTYETVYATEDNTVASAIINSTGNRRVLGTFALLPITASYYDPANQTSSVAVVKSATPTLETILINSVTKALGLAPIIDTEIIETVANSYVVEPVLEVELDNIVSTEFNPSSELETIPYFDTAHTFNLTPIVEAVSINEIVTTNLTNVEIEFLPTFETLSVLDILPIIDILPYVYNEYQFTNPYDLGGDIKEFNPVFYASNSFNVTPVLDIDFNSYVLKEVIFNPVLESTIDINNAHNLDSSVILDTYFTNYVTNNLQSQQIVETTITYTTNNQFSAINYAEITPIFANSVYNQYQVYLDTQITHYALFNLSYSEVSNSKVYIYATDNLKALIVPFVNHNSIKTWTLAREEI